MCAINSIASEPDTELAKCPRLRSASVEDQREDQCGGLVCAEGQRADCSSVIKSLEIGMNAESWLFWSSRLVICTQRNPLPFWNANWLISFLYVAMQSPIAP